MAYTICYMTRIGVDSRSNFCCVFLAVLSESSAPPFIVPVCIQRTNRSIPSMSPRNTERERSPLTNVGAAPEPTAGLGEGGGSGSGRGALHDDDDGEES